VSVGVPNEDVKKECVEYGKMIGRLVLSGDKHGIEGTGDRMS
jgi:hypothetical protein